MIIFRNFNHLGDCLLQLGLLKMLCEQWKTKVGFFVKDNLQYEVIQNAKFLDCTGIVRPNLDFNPLQVFDFIADESARGKMSLIEMWAKSIPCELKGNKKPFIQLTEEDYKEAHKLKLQGETFVAPFKVTCAYQEVFKAQQILHDKYAHKGYYLLGSSNEIRLPGFNPLMGLPIRVVAVLLKEAKALYCQNNGIANLAWSVGQRNIYEILTTATEWGKVPYSKEIKI